MKGETTVAKKVKQKVQYSSIIAFDIETNQYYDYTSWINPFEGKDVRILAADKLIDVPEIASLVKEVAATELANLEVVNFVAGADVARRVYNKAKEIIDTIIIDDPELYGAIGDAIELEVDRILHTKRLMGVQPVRSEVYLANFLEIPWTIKLPGRMYCCAWWQTTEDEFKNLVSTTPAQFCYNNTEINDYLVNLEKTVKKQKAPVCIVVHNLSYETNNCFKNLDVFCNWVSEDRIRFLTNNATDSYKSFDVYEKPFTGDAKTDRKNKILISFRDSWKLSGKSIEAVGASHGYPKLDYDYEAIRLPGSLTQHDFEYNKRDCEISLLAAKDAYETAQVDNTNVYEESKTFPVSANSITNAISKHMFKKEYEQMTNALSQVGRALTEEQYRDFKKVCGGGLVTVCPELAYTHIKVGEEIAGTKITGVKHVDLCSAHPSQVFKRLFPTSAPFAIEDKDAGFVKKGLETDLKKVREMPTLAGVAKDKDKFACLTPSLKLRKGTDLSGYADFTFKNLRVKHWSQSGIETTLPTLWSCKVVTRKSGVDEFDPTADEIIKPTGSNIQETSGKIISADTITIKLTFEDFLTNVGLFYEFDSFTVKNVKLYKMQYCDEYLYKQFNFFGVQKSDYKAVTKALHNRDEDRTRELLEAETIRPVDRAYIEGLLNKGDFGKAIKEAEAMLLRVKAIFNGCYGCAYQSLIRDASRLEVNDEGGVVWVSAESYDDNNKIDIMQGAYIAGWSRVDIALNTALVLNCGGIALYVATDSIMYGCTKNTSDKNLYPKQYDRKPFNKPTQQMAAARPNGAELGGMDVEPPILEFAYTQALKNIRLEESCDKRTGELVQTVQTTFSGVSENIYFEDCETFEDYFDRLVQENAYVSSFRSRKNIKAPNEYGAETGFVLQGSSVAFNDTTKEEYLRRRQYAIYS